MKVLPFTIHLTLSCFFLYSYGSYRQVFQINQENKQLILKMNRFKLDFEYDKYEFIRMDALVMERLTSSPRIADIYGHCGASVLTEFLPIEIEENVVPYGYVNKSDLHDELQVQPMNTFTPSQKLDMALRMAEAIADLHGFKDGIIVHDDIQLCQYLFKADNQTMKLNDFNRAEIMLYDEFTGQYCPYLNGPGGGNWRAPEGIVNILENLQ
jgi:serine/threonine protein kinase